jgi:hypothetical protein
MPRCYGIIAKARRLVDGSGSVFVDHMMLELVYLHEEKAPVGLEGRTFEIEQFKYLE